MIRRTLVILSVASLLLLTGCGGGGNSNNKEKVSPAPKIGGIEPKNSPPKTGGNEPKNSKNSPPKKVAKFKFKDLYFQPASKGKGVYYLVPQVAFSEDSKKLIWVRRLGTDGNLRNLKRSVLIADLAIQKPTPPKGDFKAGEYTYLSPDGRLALNYTLGDSNATVWDLTNGSKVTDLKGFEDLTLNDAVLPLHGKIAITAQSDNRSIKIWEVDSGKERITLKYKGLLMKLAVSANGKRLAAIVSHDESDHVVTWELLSGKMNETKQPDNTPTLVVSPDGDAVIVRRYTPAVRGYRTVILDAATGEVQKTLNAVEMNYKLHQTLAVSPDGRLVAAGAFGKVALWDVLSGQVIGLVELKGQESGQMRNLLFSPDSRKLVSINGGSNMRVWGFENQP